MEFRHFVVSHFNINLNEWLQNNRCRQFNYDSWMDRRIRLFREWTYPSVGQQTCQNFEWIIFCDDRTPEKYRKELALFDHIRFFYVKTGHFAVISDATWLNEAMSVFRSLIPNDATFVLQTRIDVDDLIHEKYIELVQSYFKERPEEQVMSFPWGHVYNAKHDVLWTLKYLTNQFVTLIQKWDEDFRCAFETNNDNMGAMRHPVVIEQEKDPLWVWMLHKANWAIRSQIIPAMLKKRHSLYKGEEK